jgi:DNA-binding MarR family transcriptional regulator
MAAEQRMRAFMAFNRNNPIFSVNLTMQQLKVLLLLSRQDGIPSHELTKQLGVTMATLSGIVDRLVAHDYVTRHEDPHDRRIRRIALAPAGRQAMNEILDNGAVAQRRLLSRLDDATLEMLEIVLARLSEAARAEAVEQGIVIPEAVGENPCGGATTLDG